jgi:prepilin-type processing-associated H-X9-DG protein
MNNVRQLATAVLSYTQDYDETLPPIGHNLSGAVPWHWYDMVVPYIKSTQILYCPSYTTVNEYGVGYNAEISSYWTEPAKSLGDIKSPSQMIMLADSIRGLLDSAGGCYGCCAGFYAGAPGTGSQTPFDKTVAAVRHNGGANFAFIDGHAKWGGWQLYLNDSVRWLGN